jgi:hypothetical protein
MEHRAHHRRIVARRKYLKRLGTDNTHWRNGWRGNTCSTRCAAVFTMRRVMHEGQTPRTLQENAIRKSWLHSEHLARAKPWARIPQARIAPELPLHEARNRVCVQTSFAGPCQEGLQVLLDHAVEHGFGGTPRPIDARPVRYPPPARRDPAVSRPHD